MQFTTPKETVRFPKLGWMPRTARGLGIDIGQTVTKIVLVERRRNSLLSFCSASIPTRVRASVAEIPHISWSTRELKDLSQAVRHLLSSRPEAKHSRTAVTISMSACDYRTVYVPQNTQVNMRAIQETIAQAKNDHRARCIALLPSSTGDASDAQAKLRCFSLPEDLSWSVAQALDEVGLTPQTLDGLPWCLASALRMVTKPQSADSIDLALDWSFGNPTLVAIKAGQINYVRSMLHGSVQGLTSAVCGDFQMDAAEAGHWIGQCLKQAALGVGNPAQIETYDAVSRICSQLADEIRTALEYLAWRNHGCKVGTLWLTGGATRIAGMSDLLKSRLTCPVADWQFDVGDACLTAEYAQAAALAWREVQYE